MNKILYLVFGLLLASCGYSKIEGYNSIDFNPEQIDSIKMIYHHFDTIFEKIRDYTNKPNNHIGLAIYDSVYYYKHCLAMDGQTYVEPENCILDYYLTEDEIKKSEQAVRYLYSIGINGSGYNSAFSCYCFVLKVDYPSFENYRMMTIQDKLDTAFIHKTAYELLDVKNGLILFKYRDYQ